MQGKASPLNYRKLLALELRDNLNLFLIGFTVIALFIFSGSYLALRFIKLPKFNTKHTTGKTTTKTVELKQNTYIVKEGDTLNSISTAFFGNLDHAGEIAKLNNLANPNTIEPGMKLTMPQGAKSQGQIGEGAQTSQVTSPGDTYTVQQGDDLGIIASKVYGDPNMWEKIVTANNLTDPNQLTTGQVLKIPRN